VFDIDDEWFYEFGTIWHSLYGHYPELHNSHIDNGIVLGLFWRYRNGKTILTGEIYGETDIDDSQSTAQCDVWQLYQAMTLMCDTDRSIADVIEPTEYDEGGVYAIA
jgi:hypothetical protein